MSEQSKGFLATNWFKLCIVGFGVVVLFIYWGREANLDECIDTASRNYQKEWEFSCKDQKLQPHCDLPRIIANQIEADRAKRAGECIQRYSFK